MEEILSMTEDEFKHWWAYFQVKADKEKLSSGSKVPSNIRGRR